MIGGDVHLNVAPSDHLKLIAVALAAFTTTPTVAPVATTEITAGTTVAAATTTTAARTARAFFLGTGNVDRKRPVIQLGAIHGLDGFLGFLGRRHGDEGKTAGTARHAIHHQVGFQHRAVGGERFLQVVFGSIEGNVPYKQFIAHVDRLFKNRFQTVPEKPGFKSSLNQVHLKIYHVRKALVYRTDQKTLTPPSIVASQFSSGSAWQSTVSWLPNRHA
jgi:hypothetical protein